MENQVNESLDFDAICRICLKNKENFLSIFQNGSVEKLKTYSEMVEECASVQISTDDSLPKNLCSPCSEKLEQSYKFKIQCLWSENLLQRLNCTKISNSFDNSDDTKENSLKISNSFENSDDTKENSLKISNSFENSDNTKENADATPAEYEIFIKEELIDDFELNNDLPKPDDQEINKYVCLECSIEFQTRIEYIEHNKVIHLKNVIACEFCGNIYSSASGLKRHCRTGVCEICNKDCGCRQNLRQHRNDHKNSIILKCSVCSKIFTDRTRFRRHKRVHSNKTYLCTFCGKIFTNDANLNVHIRIHTGEKRYECKICAAKFKDSGSLQSHLISHSVEKKFECDICKKTYKWRTQLQRHKQTHTTERNFSCEICDKRFKTIHNLRDHNRKHKDKNKQINRENST